MATDFQWKEGRGGLHINRGKGPKWRGEMTIDGKTVKLAGWAKENKAGMEWISLEIDTFVPQPKLAPTEAKPEFSDEIPF